MDRSLSYSADDIKLIANKRLIEFTVTPVYPTIFMCRVRVITPSFAWKLI